MAVEPTFPFPISKACMRFFLYHMNRIVMSRDTWTAEGRLEYTRIEDALASLKHAKVKHRPMLSRKEAGTLIALAQRNMAGGEYDFRDLTYRNGEEDWEDQLAAHEEILIECNQYPGSLPAIVRRLEIMVGLRQGLPDRPASTGLHSGYVKQQSRYSAP